MGGSYSKSLKYLQKGIELSPEDPHVNFIAGDIQFDNGFSVLGGDTLDLDKKSKKKKALSLQSFEDAKKSFEKTLANINLDTYKNPLAESSYTLDVPYTTTALVGDSKFDFQCAENFNIPCILLTHGYSSINIRKLKAFKIVDNLDDIFDIKLGF